MITDPIELLRSLVAIDSINPGLVPGGAGERAIADFIVAWLSERGVAAALQQTSVDGRPNVIARAPGSGSGRTLLLNAHMDTVGVAGMDDPFNAKIIDGRMYGRGSLDTKAGLAVAMCALVDLLSDPVGGDVVLAAVADEEHVSFGTEALVGSLEADAAIVYEPTDLEVLIAHRGFVWFDIEVEGVAAHGSRPDLGVDAIAKAAKVTCALDALNTEFAGRPAHPLVGTASLHASLITGGQELSSYPLACTVSFECRTLPGDSGVEVMADVERVLAEVVAADPAIRAKATVTFERPGLDQSPDSPLVSAMAAEVANATGAAPKIGGHPAWMDAALLAAADIPAVTFGPVGEGLHAVEEWVDIASVHECLTITLATARSFCR